MYFKLSLRNVKKCTKEYYVYFFSLSFSICIFYMFNSIPYQTAAINLSKVQSILLKDFSTYISIASIFISFILGILIIYANNFMIRRRKKEFSIYMSLGMSKFKVSLMLLYEIFIIGIISLIIGIFFGIILSQGLSALTAKLFSVELLVYKFEFSFQGMIKTIVYFGIMFLVVTFMNICFIRKYKLVNDLLYESRRKIEFDFYRNHYMVVRSFAMSIILIILAYCITLRNGIRINLIFFAAMVSGVVGTFLFFISLPRLIFQTIIKNKKLYLKNINIFSIRQLSSDSNSVSALMAITCLMLSLTIIILSTALTIKGAFKNNIDATTPYDASISIDTSNKESITKTLRELGFDVDNFNVQYTEFCEYNGPIMFKSIMGESNNSIIKRNYNYLMNSYIPCIKISDYNNLLRMRKVKGIELNEKEVLFLSNSKFFTSILDEFIKDNNYVRIGEKNFKIKGGTALYESIETSVSPINYLTLVLPDNEVKTLASKRSIVNINYIGDKSEMEEMLVGEYYEKHNIDDVSKTKILGTTKIMSVENRSGVSILAIYLSIYIGIIFVITSIAALALKLLSYAAENVEKYRLLKKTGVGKKHIQRSLFFQLVFYFAAPFILAIMHFIVGITAIVKEFTVYEISNVFMTSTIIGIILCLIYISYFFLTYKGYESIVSE